MHQYFRSLFHTGISPLLVPFTNAFNPAFFLQIQLVLQLVFLSAILYTYRYLFCLHRATQFRLVQWFSTAVIMAHAAAALLFFLDNSSRLNGIVLLNAVLVVPVHVMQLLQAVQFNCLSLYWLAAFISSSVICIQDSFTVFPLLPCSLRFAAHLKLLCVLTSALLVAFQCYYIKLLTNCLTTVSVFDQLTFSWLNNLIKTGHKNRAVTDHDIVGLNINVNIEYYSCQLTRYYRSSLAYALAKTFGWKLLYVILLQLIESVICFLQPLLLKHLILFFEVYDPATNNPPFLWGVVVICSMFVISLTITNLYNQFFIQLYQIGLYIKGGLMSLVYNKSLKLSQHARLEKSSGDVINLIAVDVNKIQNLSQQIHLLFTIPIKVGLAIFLLHCLLGSSIYGGLLVMVFLIPITCLLLKALKKLNQSQMKFKDSRLKLISEILNSIKCIKLYNWEESMMENINEIRNDKELKNLKKSGLIISINQFLWYLIPLVILGFTFYFYNDKLTSDIIFPALALFNILTGPIILLPALITSLIEASIASKRLSQFLDSEEIEPKLYKDKAFKDEPAEGLGPYISIDGTFQWTGDTRDLCYDESLIESLENSKIALRNVKLEARGNDMVCVVGSVGSGKSTFLNGIIGELPYTATTKYQLSGAVAYCPQIPWILNSSIRENILFGNSYDQDKYWKILEACQLVADFNILPSGDLTLVGEKGLSLSGGQKARVSLARAIYADKDIYILDDILSSVDNFVANKLIKNVLSQDGLLKNKIKVLVSNNLSVLKYCDQIICIDKNTVVQQGCTEELNFADSKPESPSLLDDESEITTVSSPSPTSSCASTLGSRTRLNSSSTSEGFSLKSAQTCATSISGIDKKLAAPAVVSGEVKWSTYLYYMKSCTVSGTFVFLLMIVVNTTMHLISNYWLKYWAESSSYDIDQFVVTYLLLGLGSGIFVFLKTLILYQHCALKASKKLHGSMIQSILSSPLSFFDTTPSGKILNRLSNDINKIDESLPKTFNKFFTSIASTLFTLGIIVYHLPVFVFPLAVLSLIYYYFQLHYVVASRDLKRIGSSSRSPIFNHLLESLYGMETIRSYGQTGLFESINRRHINFNLKSLYVFRSVNRWLSFRLQLIGALVIFLTSAIALFSVTSSHRLSSGLVGLIMGYTLEITESLNWIVKSSADIETNIICVERAHEYSNLKPEAPREVPACKPASSWPSNGKIVFRNLSAKYRDELGFCLDDLSFEIEQGSKIGIVGRTGAGKSSLALALFRIIEPCLGDIVIDDVAIRNIGLNDLRGNLSIIPQDCLAIQGTIRYNLDPLHRHSDLELMNAIQLAHLQPHLESLRKFQNSPLESSVLDFAMCEGGRNISVGQRQLLCLARALLNPSKVLILDEATGAVDTATDAVVQKTIRKEFSSKTILTVAHRLNTVFDCDKIMVLEYGKIVEFDNPTVLLQRQNSYFYKLFMEGGPY